MEKKPLLVQKNYSYYKWYQQITIELMAVVYFTATNISSTLETNLLLEKSSAVIEHLNSDSEESEIQMLVAKINTWRLTILTALSTLLTLYAGPLSDKYSIYRIVFLYVPIGGQIFADIANCLNVYYWQWRPEIAALFQCIILGSTGTQLCFHMLSITYLSHLSTVAERTTAIGSFFCIQFFGVGVGVGLSGYLIQYVGYLKSFFICVLLNMVAIVLGIKFIKKIPEVIKTEKMSLFDMHHVLECVSVVKRNRTGRKQLMIVLSIVIYPLIIGFPQGENSVLYLYLRYCFKWTAIDYSAYITFRMATIIAGTIFCTQLLGAKLKLDESVIGIIGGILDLLSGVFKFIIRASWEIYAVTLISIFHVPLAAFLLSVATKCVEPHEYGKMNAVFGLTECFIPIMYPVYNQVYRTTINTLPSAFFLISISILIPVIILYSVMYLIGRNNITTCSDTCKQKMIIV